MTSAPEDNPKFVARMRSGLVYLGEFQFLPGYCVLVAEPRIGTLEELADADRDLFLSDLGRLGVAVREAFMPRRVNYAIYGNTAPFLHAHVFPRYEWEDSDRVTQPVWTYPVEMWQRPPPLDPVQAEESKAQVRAALGRGF